MMGEIRRSVNSELLCDVDRANNGLALRFLFPQKFRVISRKSICELSLEQAIEPSGSIILNGCQYCGVNDYILEIQY